MTLTINTSNYLYISDCESITNWNGNKIAVVSDYFKEGSNSLGFTFTTNGNNDAYITGSWDLSGIRHLRAWIMTVALKELQTDASGGIQFYVSDGSNTGYYYISGKDTYPGGWYNLVVDLSRDCDSGTKPVMSSITTIGIRVVLTAAPKNVQNTWIDNVICCDGLICTSDSEFTIEDIYTKDNNPTVGGWGVIRKINGIYFLTGELIVGDESGTSSSNFKDTNQIIVFEDRKINENLYKFNVVGNSTGITKFQFGNQSGDSGIEGCTIKQAGTSVNWKFISSGSNVSGSKVYGSTLLDAGDYHLSEYSGGKALVNCNFNACGLIYPSSCTFENNTVISARDTAIRMMDGHNIKDCDIISCPSGISIIEGGLDYTLDNITFAGCNKDIVNLSDTWISCSCINGSNAQTYANPNGGTTKILNNQSLIINGIIDQSEVRVYRHSDLVELAGIENNDGTSFQYDYNYVGDVDVDIVVHKNDYISLRYDEITLGDSGYTLLVQQQKDRQYANP